MQMTYADNHWLKGARFGHRARIGVIAPAAGIVLEHEWARLLPEGVIAPAARARLDGGGRSDLEAFVRAVPHQVDVIACTKPNVVVLACALGTAFRGPAPESELLDMMAAAAGCPALGMARSAVQALRALGARRVALLSPYSEEANGWLAAYLAESGIEVGRCGRLAVGPAAAADLEPAEVAQCASDLLEIDPGADALWLACGNVRTLEIVESLESATGRVVVSSNIALLWASLRKCGLSDQIKGVGRLWRH
jgi:maleate isomerase